MNTVKRGQSSILGLTRSMLVTLVLGESWCRDKIPQPVRAGKRGTLGSQTLSSCLGKWISGAEDLLCTGRLVCLLDRAASAQVCRALAQSRLPVGQMFWQLTAAEVF
jgi:hypothetical protein